MQVYSNRSITKCLFLRTRVGSVAGGCGCHGGQRGAANSERARPGGDQRAGGVHRRAVGGD